MNKLQESKKKIKLENLMAESKKKTHTHTYTYTNTHTYTHIHMHAPTQRPTLTTTLAVQLEQLTSLKVGDEEFILANCIGRVEYKGVSQDQILSQPTNTPREEREGGGQGDGERERERQGEIGRDK